MAEENKTSTGLPRNILAAVCYLPIPYVGWLAPIIIFLVEKDKFVRFHAAQAFVFMIAATVLTFAMIATLILALLVPLVLLAAFVMELYMAYQAYLGKEYMFPKIGEFVKTKLAKIS